MAKIVDHSERQPGVSLIKFVSFAISVAKQLKKIKSK